MRVRSFSFFSVIVIVIANSLASLVIVLLGVEVLVEDLIPVLLAPFDRCVVEAGDQPELVRLGEDDDVVVVVELQLAPVGAGGVGAEVVGGLPLLVQAGG